ncbi:hypothetical protein E0L10_03075 [Enterococcus durans]|uniref:hypothetical protein n=1 Tax=Enterococcus durans TaxID=53345 RepID=UPI001431FCF1|nr:hypothetical protein [Enterococcus durans]NJE63176.1 hypothetical protein [Enterococcus durans]
MYNDEKIEDLLRVAHSKRYSFINSPEYGSIMIQLLLQLLNLDESRFGLSNAIPYKQNIELLAVYQEYVKHNLPMFSHRNVELLDSSLEKSIYGSIEPQLVSNYIDNLVANTQDSFLVLPLSTLLLKVEGEKNELIGHEVGAVVRKIEEDLVVSIIDKADTRIENRLQVSPPDENIQSNLKKGIVEYQYKIKNSPEHIEQLSEILGLGLRTDLNYVCTKMMLLEEHKKQELLFSSLSKVSYSEGWGTKVGNYQYYLGNCFTKEIDGAIKFVLFDTYDADLLKSESKQSLQEKIQHCSPNSKRYSTKEVSKDIVAIIEKQLEVLQFDPQVYKSLLTEIFQHYLQLKEARQSCMFQKIIQTTEASKIYSQRDFTIPKLQSTSIKPNEFKLNLKSLSSEKKEQREQQI